MKQFSKKQSKPIEKCMYKINTECIAFLLIVLNYEKVSRSVVLFITIAHIVFVSTEDCDNRN